MRITRIAFVDFAVLLRPAEINNKTRSKRARNVFSHSSRRTRSVGRFGSWTTLALGLRLLGFASPLFNGFAFIDLLLLLTFVHASSATPRAACMLGNLPVYAYHSFGMRPSNCRIRTYGSERFGTHWPSMIACFTTSSDGSCTLSTV